MKADDVIRYLRDNPDLLSEHGEIFTEITVPHPHAGQAITLAERQLHALRDKIRKLEGKLSELIRFGEENDEIGAKMHRLALALIEAEGFDDVRLELVERLRDEFQVPHVAFRVWNNVLSREDEEFAEVSEPLRDSAAEMAHPYCGAPSNLEVLGWMGASATHVRSVALVPLRAGGKVFGMLALGSEDAERFYPEMGTFYLSRLGELVAAVLRRELG